VVAGRKIGRIAAAAVAAIVLVALGSPAEQLSRPKVALVLFHGCHAGASSRDWLPLEKALRPGFARVIALDLPGHGQAGGKPIEAEGNNDAWMAAWREHGTGVVDRAFARARAEAPGALVVAGGAGCGGYFALIGAQRHDVKAVLTLSGLSDAAQRQHLTSKKIPVLGVASKGDRDVPARVDAIVRAGGEGSALKLYPGSAHGTAILTEQGGSVGDVLQWIEERSAGPSASARPGR
jgi:alpha-beta hydrolase superfamily lysophospholipase